MTQEHALRADLLAAIPSLRAFAYSLCGNHDTADDLVQETLLKALANIASFQPGTSMSAWMFTILRNAFYSLHRKRRREVEDPDEMHALHMAMPPTQMTSVAFTEFLKALSTIAPHQREALYLIDVMGLSLDEAAIVMDVALGTAKSRVIRARARLIALLQPDGLGSTFFETTQATPQTWGPS